jgi:hypothetical protein
MSSFFRTIVALGFITAPVIEADETRYQQFKDEDAAAYNQLDRSLATQFLTRPESELTKEMREGYEQWKPSNLAYEWTPGVKTPGTFKGSEYSQSWGRWTARFFRMRNYERANRYERAYLRQDPSLFKMSWLERKIAEMLYPPRPLQENEKRIDLGELLRMMDRADYAAALQKEYEAHNPTPPAPPSRPIRHDLEVRTPYADPSLNWR